MQQVVWDSEYSVGNAGIKIRLPHYACCAHVLSPMLLLSDGKLIKKNGRMVSDLTFDRAQLIICTIWATIYDLGMYVPVVLKTNVSTFYIS